jgi:hypothetical protein
MRAIRGAPSPGACCYGNAHGEASPLRLLLPEAGVLASNRLIRHRTLYH